MRTSRAALSVFAFVFGIAFVSSIAFAQPLFNINDAFPNNATTANVTVRVCSASNVTAVGNFTFWRGGALANILAAQITQCGGGAHGNTFNSSNISALSLISQSSCDAAQQIRPLFQPPFPQCADFQLNLSWSYLATQINVTAFNQSTFNAANVPNSSMITANQIAVQTNDSTGAALGNVILMAFDPSTNSYTSFSQGPAVTDSGGFFAQHCYGQINSTGGCSGQATGFQDNQCIWHGTPFFSATGAPSPTSTSACLPLNGTTFLGYDFISSNTSSSQILQNVHNNITLSTSSAVSFVDIFGTDFSNPFTGPSFGAINLSSVQFYNSSGNLVFSQLIGQQGGFVPPVFLDVNRIYTAVVNVTTASGNNIYNFSILPPSIGMFGAMIALPSSAPSSYTTLRGIVLNSTGQAVPFAVVYAQLHNFGSPPMGISFVNSTTADANGFFSIAVPTSQIVSFPFGGSAPFPTYDIYVISNQTNSTGGIPIYFPTLDTNSQRGFVARGTQTILPATTLKPGGLATINVTLNGASGIISELSLFSTGPEGTSRTAYTSKMSMLSPFSGTTPPSSIVVPLVSPTGSVVLNLFGQNQSFGGFSSSVANVCFNTTSVVQGANTDTNCNLTTPGTLNLSVETCDTIFNGTCTPNGDVGSMRFWFENKFELLDAAKNTVWYLDTESAILEMIIGFGGFAPSASLPVPAGNYTTRLSPGFEFARLEEVTNTTNVTMASGATTNLLIRRGQALEIEPRFFGSLELSAANSINVTVRDGAGNQLNDSLVTLFARLLYANKSAATPLIAMGYDASTGLFFNTTFNPSAFSLPAGRYFLLLNATNISSIHSTLTKFPMSVFDFGVGLDLGGFTFGTGRSINGKIYAFNVSNGSPLNGNATIIVRDDTGASVGNTVATTVTNGVGNFTVTAPSTVGFYEMEVAVNSSGKFGLTTQWFQVSNLAISVSTDRQSYAPSDIVSLKVEVRNASTGAGISGAAVEATVDNNQNPVTGVTGSSVVLALDPRTIAGGNWTFGFHSIRIRISIETASGITKLDTFYGFEVRGVEIEARPDKPRYAATDTVRIDIFVPPEISVTGSPTVVLDGNSSNTYAATQLGPGFFQANLGTQSVGRHSVKASVSTPGGTQTGFAGFEVTASNIIARTDKFVYSTGEPMILYVSVLNATTSAAIPDAFVNVTLHRIQHPTDIQISRNDTVTNSTGGTALTLNSSQAGPHYLRVNVSNQVLFMPVVVSGMTVELRNATAATTSFRGAPGGTVAVLVNATSGGAPIADGSTVAAKIWAFGTPIELTPNTTVSGYSNITFTIPTSAPRTTYGLDVKVTTPGGDSGFAPPSTLTVEGGASLVLRVDVDRPGIGSYAPGESGAITATLRFDNGTAVSGANITFEKGKVGATSSVVGTALTDSSGKANITVSSMGSSDGPHYIQAYLTTDTSVRAYTGYFVTGIAVTVVTNQSSYNLGDMIAFNVTAVNSSTGSALSATSGFISIFQRERGIVTIPLTIGAAQPYTANVTVPNEASAVGSYGLAASVSVNSSVGMAFGRLKVQNGSHTVNVSVPGNLSAGTPFNVTLNSTGGTGGSLTIFAPGAASVVFTNSSIPITAGVAQNISVNITQTGVYVVDFRVAGIGSDAKIMVLNNTGAGVESPLVWTGSSVSTNSSSFSSGATVFISSNIANTTATVLTKTATNTTLSYSLALTLTSGSNYYTTFTPAVTGTHFVRLDSSTATGIATAMFTVS